MSEGKIAALLVGCFVVATSIGTWAAYSYAVPSMMAALNEATLDKPSERVPHISNANTKADRLPVRTETVGRAAAAPVAAATPAPAAYNLAAYSAMPVEPPKPRVELPKPAPDKAKRAEQQKLLLDDAQIASLKTRLKLADHQEEFWPAVEASLRDVVHAHARKSRKAPHGVAPQIDVNSPEVQQLIAAAVPLIMRLSEEQKREVRSLARVIGLETVASKI